jgi:hypothetical protein
MKTLFIYIFTLLLVNVNAQQHITFQKEIKSNGQAMDIIDINQCADGSYLVLAMNDIGSPNVVKLNNIGGVIWSKSLFGNIDYHRIGEKTGGGYYLCGSILDTGGYYPALVFLTNQGDFVSGKFYKRLNSYSIDMYSPYKIKQMSNGNFLISANSDESMGIIRTDDMGNVIFSKYFSSDSTKNPSFDLSETSDGGIISCGKSDSYKMFVKIDASGNLQWSKTFIEPNYYTHIKSITRTYDGNIVAVGFESDINGNTYCGFVMKIDNAGNILWHKRYSDQNNQIYFLDINEIWGGNLVISTRYPYTYAPAVLVTDNSGNILSSNTVANIGAFNYHLKKINNDDILLSMTGTDFQTQLFRSLLFKSDWISMLWCDKTNFPLTVTNVDHSNTTFSSNVTTYSGCIANSISLTTTANNNITSTDYCASTSITENKKEGSIEIFPNPSNGYFNIKTSLQNFSVSVYDVLGNVVYNVANTTQLNLANQAKGVYYIQLTDLSGSGAQSVLSEKVIIQ